jgi:hypothetical protein
MCNKLLHVDLLTFHIDLNIYYHVPHIPRWGSYQLHLA